MTIPRATAFGGHLDEPSPPAWDHATNEGVAASLARPDALCRRFLSAKERKVATSPRSPVAAVANHGAQKATEIEDLLERLNRILEANYADPDFRAGDISDQLAMSPRTLQRKLNEAGQSSPKVFLQELRLHKAAEALAAGEKPSQVAFDVGFSSHSYFSRCFKARYGVPPSAYGLADAAYGYASLG